MDVSCDPCGLERRCRAASPQNGVVLTVQVSALAQLPPLLVPTGTTLRSFVQMHPRVRESPRYAQPESDPRHSPPGMWSPAGGRPAVPAFAFGEVEQQTVVGLSMEIDIPLLPTRSPPYLDRESDVIHTLGQMSGGGGPNMILLLATMQSRPAATTQASPESVVDVRGWDLLCSAQ